VVRVGGGTRSGGESAAESSRGKEGGERRDSPRVRVSESETVSCCALNGRWASSSLSFDSATASTGHY
jgi:hypothetical protein